MVPMHPLRSLLKLRFWLLLGLAAVAVIALYAFNLQGMLHAGWLWLMGLGSSDPLTFILFFNLATLLCVPASLLAIRAGFVFGLGWGSLYVLVAAIIGATLAFLMGRHLAHQWVWRKIEHNVRFYAIAQSVAHEGWKIVLLTRLSPLFPFNLTNYAFGVTQISLKNYIVGSLGILPGTVLYTYMGALANELSMTEFSSTSMPLGIQIAQWGMRLTGLAATVLVTLYINRVAKRALNQRVAAVPSQGSPLQE
jgi:uncharacterized membrane protein YdjX (TVP38/TMEM64 family)